MRKALAVAMVGLGLAAGAESAHAQTLIPFSVEARGGAAFPTGDFADGVNTGWTVGADATLSVLPVLSLYGGYEYQRYGADSDPGTEGSVTNSMIRVGGKVGVPIVSMATGFSPYVLAGATVDKTKLKAADGGTSIAFESDWSVGYEAGVGASIGIAPTISLTPEVRYQSVKPDFSDTFGTNEDSARLTAFTLSVGLSFGL
jgi:opacity protein-like surface antigen